jgi:hypothetical protein
MYTKANNKKITITNYAQDINVIKWIIFLMKEQTLVLKKRNENEP